MIENEKKYADEELVKHLSTLSYEEINLRFPFLSSCADIVESAKHEYYDELRREEEEEHDG